MPHQDESRHGKNGKKLFPCIEMLREKIKEEVPSQFWLPLRDELQRLSQLSVESLDYQSLKTYLEWVSELPWKKLTLDQLDPRSVFQSIDHQHVGRVKMKERIAEHIAVAHLKNSLKGVVFCLAGPPGVGKGSLAHAIGEALGRKVIEVRLSELETEESFRGRKREGQYPTPGKMLESMMQTGTRNPVIILDGIDRPGTRWPIDPVNVLLELFDPDRNRAFIDHYLGFPFDLSDIFFITTAHTLDNIPDLLLDRMQIFQLNAYTPEEKLRIAKGNLVEQNLIETNLDPKQIHTPDSSLTILINQYTQEAGVDHLSRLLGRLYRNAAYKMVTDKVKDITVDDAMIIEVLGPPRYYSQLRERILRPGVVTGLIWTPNGGDIVFVETSVMPGKGRVVVTGQLGDVMRESAEIAVSFVRCEAKRFGLDVDLDEKDVHIHVPRAAIPKDGPSAGVTILTALFSCLSNKTVKPTLAMTGEVTLRGAVLRVGAVKEKVIAAHRAGITTVILPRFNEQDLLEVTDEVRSQLRFVLADSIDKILEETLSLKSIAPLADPTRAFVSTVVSPEM